MIKCKDCQKEFNSNSDFNHHAGACYQAQCDQGLEFDYDYQVWIKDGIVEVCGHPDSMRVWDQKNMTLVPCCNAWILKGHNIKDVETLVKDGVVTL